MKVLLQKHVIEPVYQWWRGEYVPPPSFEETYPLIIISPGHYKRSKIVLVIEAIIKSIRTHWQFWIGTLIGAIGLIIGLVK